MAPYRKVGRFYCLPTSREFELLLEDGEVLYGTVAKDIPLDLIQKYNGQGQLCECIVRGSPQVLLAIGEVGQPAQEIRQGELPFTLTGILKSVVTGYLLIHTKGPSPTAIFVAPPSNQEVETLELDAPYYIEGVIQYREGGPVVQALAMSLMSDEAYGAREA